MAKFQSKKERSEGPESLQKMTADTMISNLGHVAEDIISRFSCGGKLELLNGSAVKVAYKITTNTVAQPSTSTTEIDEVWRSIEFPGASKVAISKLLDVCSVASFGYKDKDVIDKSYRDALKLDPIDFSTSFQLCNTPIIREIESLIPNCAGLQAELYKLNIYAPGGFFKPHVDTPQSGQMFGSLVVCLPTHFNGGELIVRHEKKEIKYDWSSPDSDLSNSLQWAAFFSDIEHEVLPVTEGYRVTLTYNLYYGINPGRPLIDVRNNPFYKTLQAALSNPIFMRDGGVLGFKCHYSYVFDIQWADLLAFTDGKDQILSSLDRLPLKWFVSYSASERVEVLRRCGIDDAIITQILDVIPSTFPRLKGGDYIVFESAKLLKLPVHVKPFLDRKDDDYETGKQAYGYALKDFSSRFGKGGFDSNYELPCWGLPDKDDDISKEDAIAFMLFEGDACKYDLSDITWCQDWKWYFDDRDVGAEPCGALGHYGNELAVSIWYKLAVILIGIPKWGDRCSIAEQGCQAAADDVKGDNFDVVEKCFKNLDSHY